MSLAVIDIGGTSIKFGQYDSVTGVSFRTNASTPKTLPEFYKLLQKKIVQLRAVGDITGVAISSPGMVDQITGIIRGASAVPYIHNFPIVAELNNRFELPVAIENDANCAALAEVHAGAARDVRDAVFIVLGTGVGGAVVLNRQVRHGQHLLGGELGYMLHGEADTVSHLGTVVNAVARYNRINGTKLDGKGLYELAQHGNVSAKKAIQDMLDVVATTIFNLQYSLDPECFIIGGGVSQNPALLTDLEPALDSVMAHVGIAPLRPQIRIASFQADANLYGAAINFEQFSLRNGD